MGVPSITAGRILKGQLRGNSGEETVLAMDQFTHLGLSKVYIYTLYKNITTVVNTTCPAFSSRH